MSDAKFGLSNAASGCMLLYVVCWALPCYWYTILGRLDIGRHAD